MSDGSSATICGQCGEVFECQAHRMQHCWCGQLPLLIPTEGASCWCPECLRLALIQKTEAVATAIQQGKRVNDTTQYAHLPLQSGLDYYVEHGRYVFKPWYLLRRGYCCGNGCRHCPYERITK